MKNILIVLGILASYPLFAGETTSPYTESSVATEEYDLAFNPEEVRRLTIELIDEAYNTPEDERTLSQKKRIESYERTQKLQSENDRKRSRRRRSWDECRSKYSAFRCAL